MHELRHAIKKEKNQEERRKLKTALQIMENRQRAESQKKKQQEIISKHKKQERQQIKDGKTPYFLKQKAIKELELQEKYKELTKKGGEAEVDRYLRDKRKRKAQKDVRFMPFKRRAVEGEDGAPQPSRE